MFCNVCHTHIGGEGQIMDLDHYKSDWHRYNVKLQVVGGAPITEEAFQLKYEALRNKLEEQLAAQEQVNCEVCRKKFHTPKAHEQHLQSKNHQKQAILVAQRQEVKDKKLQAKRDAVVAAADVEEGAVVEGDGAVEDSEGEGEGGGARPQLEAAPIPPTTCLFCPRQGRSIRNNLKHMIREHGFFVPFVEYAVDLEGLLEYLGYKVGMGHICIWCNGRGRAAYGSLEAVQQHMLAKSHCRIRMDETLDAREQLDDDEDEEFEGDEDDEETDGKVGSVDKALSKLQLDASEEKDDLADEDEDEGDEGEDDVGRPSPDEYLPFYRFPGQVDEIEEEIDGKVVIRELAEITPAERRRTAELYPKPIPEPQAQSAVTPVDIAPSQELVLSDGSIIGHRQYAVIYRQNVRETKRGQLIQSIVQRRGINQGQLMSRPESNRNPSKRSEMDRRTLRDIERSTRSMARQNNTTTQMFHRPQILF